MGVHNNFRGQKEQVILPFPPLDYGNGHAHFPEAIVHKNMAAVAEVSWCLCHQYGVETSAAHCEHIVFDKQIILYLA